MTAKRSKLAVFLFVVSIICIILKLLISYLFPYSRLLLWFIIIPVISICLIIIILKNRKSLLNKRVLCCSLLSLAAVVFALLPIDRQLELARFYVFKGYYSSVAQEVQKNISSSEDTMFGRYDFPQSMLNPFYKGIVYHKHGDSVAILFTVSSSLSITRYYVYFSDTRARDLFEHPEQIDNQYKEGDFCDRIEELDGYQWAYVINWGNLTAPKDPDL